MLIVWYGHTEDYVLQVVVEMVLLKYGNLNLMIGFHLSCNLNSGEDISYFFTMHKMYKLPCFMEQRLSRRKYDFQNDNWLTGSKII